MRLRPLRSHFRDCRYVVIAQAGQGAGDEGYDAHQNEGGGQGARGAITLSDGRELQDKSQVALAADERFTLQLPGGGGYFDPYTRDVRAVLDDVLDGFVSVEAARADYGIVVDSASMIVDEEATAALRASVTG